MKIDWKKMLPHVVAICVFVGISMAYFYPAMQGNMIKSHDINMHKGMSKEISDHREEYGEEPLWTNSAFGGMPATQISVKYDSNLIGKLDKIIQLGLPHPISYLFLYMIGFYILLLCMKVDPWLALAGAIAYGFSSYFFIIMGAGHNSKAVAVAYMAPALGGFLLVFRNKILLGTAIMTLFMSLQINANHPQVTYYFFILLFFIFVYYAIQFIKKKEVPSLAKRVGLIALGTLLAVSTNVPNLYGTYEYSPHTQRGGSELTPIKKLTQYANEIDTVVLNRLISTTGCEMPKCILELTPEQLVQKTGLDKETVDGVFKVLTQKGMSKDYALNWSYGKGETWNFMIPNVKGGTSSLLLGNQEFMENDGNTELKEILQLNYQMYQSGVTRGVVKEYFGNQASTSGPVYIGAIVCLLFILGMVFWKNKLKWPLLIMVILSIMLAWGKNLMWLTDLFWNNVPVYNKFRAVTIILVMVELILPIVGFLWLLDVIKNKENYQGTIKLFGKKEVESKKLFLGVSGFVVFVTLLFAVMPGTLIDLKSNGDKTTFDGVNFTKQINAMVMSNPTNVPPEYAENPEQYATALTQHYMPKLDQAEKQLVVFREGVVKKDAFRSLIFILIGIALLYFLIYKEFNPTYFSLALAAIILIDLWPVALRYLNNEPGQQTEYAAWEEREMKMIPFIPTYSDIAIMNNEFAENPSLGEEVGKFIQMKTSEKGEALTYREDASKKFDKLNQLTNYKVFLLGDYSQETSISYFHKSLGGYHAAKIQRYQDLIERKMQGQMQLASNPNTLNQATILNMLNTKYIIANKNGEGLFIDMNSPATLSQENQQTTPGFYNSNAFGNAWFVSEVKDFNSPDEEFAALDTEDLTSIAIADQEYENNTGIIGDYANNGNEVIKMTSYKANEIKYSLENITGGEHYTVFSEVYFPLGWKAYVDGVETSVNRVNYTLRGVKLPEGAKEVVLKYELKSFDTLSAIALASSSMIILLVLGLGYLSIVKGKDD